MYEAIKAKGLKTIEECFDMIETDLSSVHAAGDSFTAVDAFVFVFLALGSTIWDNQHGEVSEVFKAGCEPGEASVPGGCGR
jgi:hypothetical protein